MQEYIGRRFLRMLFTIWLGASAIFFIPRFGGNDPADAVLGGLLTAGGTTEGADEMIAAYSERFGFDDPLFVQYGKYLKNIVLFDNGLSISAFPASVDEQIGRALPWTIGLMSVAILLSFLIGNLIGALLGWPATKPLTRAILSMPLFITAIPAFMVGLILLWIFSFRLQWLPFSGAYDPDVVPGWNLSFIGSVIKHGFLPAVSVILVRLGGFALGMRGMMITTAGQDYMLLAEAKGLSKRRKFFRYGVRNTLAPQLTELGVAIGSIAGGFVIVERVFNYPGLGSLLFRAILTDDFPLIQGVVVYLIIGVTAMAFLLDIAYPLIDPRISYSKDRT